VLRHLVIKREGPDTEQSLIMKTKDEKGDRRRRDDDSDSDVGGKGDDVVVDADVAEITEAV